MTDASLGHDGNRDSLHDLLDHVGVGHARDATLNSDIGGDPFEGHDGGGAGFLGDASLFQRSDGLHQNVMIGDVCHIPAPH